MRLFLYYALHSFINQLRKLFRTWVIAFILICGLMGGLIGFTVGSLMENNESSSSIEIVEEEKEEESEEGVPSSETLLPEAVQGDLTQRDLLELGAGLLILAVLLFEIYGADKSGSKIFLPADVNILFPSPLKPQSVLLFRLVTRLGTALLFSIYLFIEIPSLSAVLGGSSWLSWIILLAWALVLVSSKLIQILLYTLASTRPGLRRHIRHFVYAAVLLLMAAVIAAHRSSDTGMLSSAARLLNAPFTRWVPIWGWIKGLIMFSAEGKTALVFLEGILLAISILLLAWIIWRIPADFYEEAMAKAEEVAEVLQAAAQSESSGMIIKRKKDRSEGLLRDGLRRGRGASVLITKSLYNRFRFAHLHIFTKTAETYLVAAIGTALLCRFVLETRSLTPVGLVLAGLAFFRAMGNPLSQDTSNPIFRMMPEPGWKKLLFSLLGGTVDCLLDVLIAIIPAVIILQANPLSALSYVLFIATVDYYASIVGTFIDLSVPVSAGKIIKQLVQILFIYFGLIPDAILILVGFQQDRILLYLLIACLVNLAIGSLFLILTPVFLDPKDVPAIRAVPLDSSERKAIRKRFSLMGLACFAVLALCFILQMAAVLCLNRIVPNWTSYTWVIWALSFVPLYLVAVPCGLLILRKVPAISPTEQTWSFGRLFRLFPICIFLMYIGSIVGTLLTLFFQAILPVSGVSPLDTLIEGSPLFLRILVVVILAPLVEEFFFRRQLIDRMQIYGEKRAVILSALIFGLFHGNLQQMFYAFLLGLVFGYVYLKSGRLRYTVILHMVINFMGSVIAPEMLSRINLTDLEALSLSSPGMVPILVYLILLAVLFVLGLVLLILSSRRIRYLSAEKELPRKGAWRIACCNTGMILFLIGCLTEIIINMI